MVTCTELHNVLRISYEYVRTDTSLGEIVCFARPTDTGIEINYSHHAIRNRTIPKGPWGPEQYIRMPLAPFLVSQIQSMVMVELWSMFGHTVRTLPAPVGTNLKLIRFDEYPLQPFQPNVQGVVQ